MRLYSDTNYNQKHTALNHSYSCNKKRF